MLPKMRNGGVSFQDQCAFQSTANGFHFARMPRIVLRPTQSIVEDMDQADDVILDVLSLRRRPVKHVHNFQIKPETIATDDDIVRMQIAVIFAQPMNALHSND